MAGEQQQQQQVDPQQARTFLTNFGHAEDALKGMPDPDVVKLYSGANGFVTKTVEEKVKEATSKVPVFGEKWRETLAGEDPEDLKTLTRFKDPTALWQRTKELNKKFSSGEVKVVTPFPEKGTDQEKAAWRKEQGIPDAPDKYDLKFDNGLVIGEDDKPIVAKYLQHAHSRNFTPAQVKENIGWFLSDFKTMAEQERAESVARTKQATEDKLREAWKGDYRMRRTAVENLVTGHFGGSDSDLGKLVMASVETHPEFAQSLANLALELNPAAPLMPPSDSAAGQMVNIETKIKEIEGLMKTDRKAYNARSDEYRQLLEAREKMKARGAPSA